jgi:hypothetical protein
MVVLHAQGHARLSDAVQLRRLLLQLTARLGVPCDVAASAPFVALAKLFFDLIVQAGDAADALRPSADGAQAQPTFVIVLDSFQELARRSASSSAQVTRQPLLYLLSELLFAPARVCLIAQSRSLVTADGLEKRVRSRLNMRTIVFPSPLTTAPALRAAVYSTMALPSREAIVDNAVAALAAARSAQEDCPEAARLLGDACVEAITEEGTLPAHLRAAAASRASMQLLAAYTRNPDVAAPLRAVVEALPSATTVAGFNRSLWLTLTDDDVEKRILGPMAARGANWHDVCTLARATLVAALRCPSYEPSAGPALRVTVETPRRGWRRENGAGARGAGEWSDSDLEDEERAVAGLGRPELSQPSTPRGRAPARSAEACDVSAVPSGVGVLLRVCPW